MRKDSRLSRMLHVLVHMHHLERAVTSDCIASMLGTNPVVVRRTMSLLREQGYVNAVKGHGGGWTLAKPLHCITLLDIHRSLSEASLFTIGLTDEHNSCPIEKAVNLAIDDVLHEAEQLVLRRFAEVTLDTLATGYVAKPKLNSL